jgi:hypothetical protein
VTHYYARGLGAAERDPVVALGEAAQAMETRMRAAGPEIAGTYAWLRSLSRSARALGLSEAVLLGPQLSSQIASWRANAQAWGKAIRAMDQGRAELQPWRVGNGPIVFAVRKLNGETGELGWWAIALKVFTVAVAAAAPVVGGSWLLIDAWQSTEKLKAEGAIARAGVLQTLAEKQGGDPRAAAAIAQEVGRANSEASAGASSWLDTLAGSAGAGLGGAALALGAMFLLSRARESAPATPRRSFGSYVKPYVPRRATVAAGGGGILLGAALAYGLSRKGRAG